MAGLVILKTNQDLLGALLAHVALLTTAVTYRACYLTGPAMRHAALGTTALALLAFGRSIKGLGLLGPTQ